MSGFRFLTPESMQGSPAARQMLSPDLVPDDDEGPGFFETVGAMYQEETIVGNLYTLAGEPGASVPDIHQAWSEGYDSAAELDRILVDEKPQWAGNLEFHSKLLEQPTKARFDYWVGQLDQQAENDETMNQAGMLSLLGAGVTAVGLDPFSWMVNLGLGPLAGATRASKFLGAQLNAQAARPLLALRAQALARGETEAAEQLAGQAMRTVGGKSFGIAMRESIVPATVDVSIAEFLAQEAQPDRGWEESITNLAGSVAFSGILGGAAGVYGKFVSPAKDRFITSHERKRGMAGAQELIDSQDSFLHPNHQSDLFNRGQSVSAAFVYDGQRMSADPEELTRLAIKHGGDTDEYRHAKMKHEREFSQMAGADKRGLNWVWRMHPSARMGSALNPQSRIIGQALLEQDYLYSSITRGESRYHSVESNTHLDVNDDTIRAYKIVSDGYNSLLRKKFPNEANRWRELSLRHNQTRKAYNNELSAYIYDKDHVFSTEFEPYADEIMTAANRLNREVMAKWEKKRIAIGVLESKKTPTDQRFYLKRKWNRAFTKENSVRLEQLLREEYRAQLILKDPPPAPGQSTLFGTPPKASEIILSILDEGRDWSDSLGVEGYRKWLGKAEELRDEMELNIEDFIQKVTSSGIGVMPEGSVIESRSLKARISIPSKKLLQLDGKGDSFLVRDVMEITESFLRDAVPDYHIRTAFDDDGKLTKTMTMLRKSYTDDIDVLRKLEAKTTDPKVKASYAKEMKDLRKERDQMVKDIKNSLNVIKYNFGHPEDPDTILSNANKIARTVNFMGKLGSMTVSAFTDLAYIVMKTGFAPMLGAVATKFKKSLITNKRGGGVTKADLNELAIVTELFMHGKARAMFNMDDLQGMTNNVDRWSGYASTQFSRVSMMNRWNHTMKEIAATAYVLKLRRHLNGTSAKDVAFVRDMGFNEGQAKIIKQQWDTHGVKDVGIDAPNMRKWSNPGARRAMRLALLRATDSTVVTPGAGDIPHVMRKQWGRLVFQFQSFPVSVMSRVAIPALQRFPDGKAEVMSGMAMALTLGAMVSMIKDASKGNDVNTDPAHLARQALDRSGLFGYYMTGWRLGEDVLGLDELFTGEFEQFTDSHRSRNPATEFLGPTFRTAEDALRVIRGMRDGAASVAGYGDGATQGAYSAFRRLMPGNNLFYLDALNRAAQEWITGEELK